MGLYNFSFYDKPDGEAPFEKLLASMKMPITAGCMFGIFEGHMAKGSRLDTFATVGKILRRTIPLCSIAFFFSSATFIAARIRNKDGPLNHVIGALATTPVIRRLSTVGATLGTVPCLVLLAYGIKDCTMAFENRMEKADKELQMGTTYEWYKWSQGKPASAGYIKYN